MAKIIVDNHCVRPDFGMKEVGVLSRLGSPIRDMVNQQRKCNHCFSVFSSEGDDKVYIRSEEVVSLGVAMTYTCWYVACPCCKGFIRVHTS